MEEVNIVIGHKMKTLLHFELTYEPMVFNVLCDKMDKSDLHESEVCNVVLCKKT